MKKFVMIFAATMALLLLVACGQNVSSKGVASSSASVTSMSLSEPEVSSVPTPESRPAFDSPEAWEGELPSALCTGWHASSVLGSGFSDRFLFLENGTFYFTANGMNYNNRTRYMDGVWRYEDGVVHLEVHHKVVIEGGKLTDGFASIINYIEGGVHCKIELQPNEYEEILLPVEITDAGEDSPYPNSILLNEVQYWDAAGVMYDDMLDAWDWYEDGDPSDKFV